MTGHEGRILWRLAWRVARARPGRHLLIVGLLVLAVAGSVATSIGVRNVIEPPELRYAVTFGSADVTVRREPAGVTYEQLPFELQREVDDRHGGPLDPLPASQVDARIHELVPDHAGIARTDETLLRIAGLGAGPFEGQTHVFAADPSEPVLAGRFVGDVAAAPADGEVLLSHGALRELDVTVGDRIAIETLGELEVVGVASDPQSRSRPLAIVAPDARLPAPVTTTWYVGGIGVDVAEDLAVDLDPASQGIPLSERATPREAGLYTTTRANIGFGSTGNPVVIGSLVATVLLVQVGFIAAAAFATGTRRRIRDFGLLAAAAGADPGHVRGMVRREALVLGVAGAGMGAAIGLAGTWLALPLLEQIADRSLGAFDVATADVVLPALLAIVASLAAAWLPARTVANVPLTAALAGRVPLRRVARWVAPASVTVAAIGLGGIVATQRATRGGWFGNTLSAYRSTYLGGIDPGTIRSIGLTVGVALLLAGVAGLSGPLVQTIGRLAGRLPVHGRLALRDSARQRTRSAATVAATMVVVAVPIVAFTMAASESDGWIDRSDANRDDVAVVAGPVYGGSALSSTDEQIEIARAALPTVTAEVEIPILSAAPDGWMDITLLAPLTGEMRQSAVWGIGPTQAGLATPDLRAALGVGATGANTVVLGRTPGGEGFDRDRFQARLTRPGGASADVEIVLAQREIAYGSPDILLPEAVANELGFEVVATHTLLELASSPTETEREAAWAAARDAEVPFQVGIPSQAGSSGFLGIVLIGGGIGMLLALAIAAATAALAATESDHDLRTMAAVGADPRLRPRFRAVQAAYHVALGSVLAVPAGLLLAAAFQSTGQWSPELSVPVVAITGFVLVCPFLVALPFRLLSRTSPTRLPVRRHA